MNKDIDPKHLRVRKGENLPHLPLLREVSIEMHAVSLCSSCCLPNGEISCEMAKKPKRGTQRVAHPITLPVRDPEIGNLS